jgi:hypothetical protein
VLARHQPAVNIALMALLFTPAGTASIMLLLAEQVVSTPQLDFDGLFDLPRVCAAGLLLCYSTSLWSS